MKLRNKRTGEIKEYNEVRLENSEYGEECYTWFDSLAELNEEWEDYEEPKEYWFIDFNGEIKEFEVLGFEWQGWMKEIGNYFETKEEAEKAVEKLKTLERLKNWGLRPAGWHRVDDDTIVVRFDVGVHIDDPIQKDLDLLFSGEDN